MNASKVQQQRVLMMTSVLEKNDFYFGLTYVQYEGLELSAVEAAERGETPAALPNARCRSATRCAACASHAQAPSVAHRGSREGC